MLLATVGVQQNHALTESGISTFGLARAPLVLVSALLSASGAEMLLRSGGATKAQSLHDVVARTVQTLARFEGAGRDQAARADRYVELRRRTIM